MSQLTGLTHFLEGIKVYISPYVRNYKSTEEVLLRHNATVVQTVKIDVYYFVSPTNIQRATLDQQLTKGLVLFGERMKLCKEADVHEITNKGYFPVSEDHKKNIMSRITTTRKRKREKTSEIPAFESPYQKVWAIVREIGESTRENGKPTPFSIWPFLIFQNGDEHFPVGNYPFEISYCKTEFVSNNFFSDADVHFIPAEFKEEWLQAVKAWEEFDIPGLLDGFIVEDNESVYADIKGHNSNLGLPHSLVESLSDALVSVETVNDDNMENELVPLFSNDNTSSVEVSNQSDFSSPSSTIENLLNNDALFFKQKKFDKNPVKNLVQYLQKTAAGDVLSPFYYLFNHYFLNDGEMNYQELLASLMSPFIAAFQGKLVTTSQSFESLDPTIRTSAFIHSFVKPDKMVCVTIEKLKSNWPVLLAEFKPDEHNLDIWNHPDFKKMVVMMKCCLKDMILELIELQRLTSKDEISIHSLISVGRVVYVLKMRSDTSKYPIEKKDNEYACTYTLNVSTGFDVSQVLQASRLLLNLIHISQYWENMGERFLSLKKEEMVTHFVSSPNVKQSSVVPINLSWNDIMDQMEMEVTSISRVLFALINSFATLQEAQEYLKERYFDGRDISFNVRETVLPVDEKYNLIVVNSDHQYAKYTCNSTKEPDIYFVLFEVKNQDNGKIYYKQKVKMYGSTKLPAKGVIKIITNDSTNLELEKIQNRSKNHTSTMKQQSKFDEKWLQPYGLTVEKILSSNQDHVYGFGKYKDETMFFKISEKQSENVTLMKRMVNISNSIENIGKILMYEPIESDRMLTVSEMLFSKRDIGWDIKDPSSFCISILFDMLTCLSHLHDCNIVHSDVSDDNIMFRKTRDGYRAVLIDCNNCYDTTKTTDEQCVKIKYEYSPNDDSKWYSECHDLYSLAISFCVFVDSFVNKNYMYNITKESCMFTFSNRILSDIRDPTILKLVPLINEMLDCKISSSNQAKTKLESFL